MSELRLADVRKVYQTRGGEDVTAVRGVSLEVGSGELVALLGPSGCGKSTTLRMIAGLEELTSGDILIGGRSMVGLPPQRRNIGVAFENYALYPPLSVAQNITFGLRARKRQGWQQRLTEITERLDLVDILDDKPGGLSSGQKQRVALARAIARQPEVLLLDEPLSHLDAAQRDTTRRELRRLQQDLGYTTILVTHDQEEAISLADRVVVMRDGLIQQVGTPEEVYDDPANLFVADFVGEPPMNLLDGVLERDADGSLVRVSAEVALPVRVTGDAGNGTEVVVGVRPETLRPLPAGDPDAVFTGEVLVVEDVLEFALITVRLPGTEQHVVVQTEAGPGISPGQAVGLRPNIDRTLVFQRGTGERIR
ncbi:ABC transporter ATP-binding protein [Goodfellowiella coeruleoviolacea]|uniref:ABC-type sugar transport system, ATPase component n=1 Tax=Goodfellowiella coeruleoviolacea TaxID=334858 RepID=A0AAE3GB18_9PSEU|nr:ABC transporter ATP-binding protein [Goodfellowiella coeruleoviolacea]MCP2164523.1 ABC-type sugar transport system, ATPase component [Goodfellowiella coeruleoviolacea]